MPNGEHRSRRRWGVQASVLAEPGREPKACRIFRMSRPPKPGSGLTVRGLDLDSVPDVTVYDNGTVKTPRLRLVGTNDLWTLTLTEPATLATDDPALSRSPPERPDGSLPVEAAASIADLRNLQRSIHVDRDVLEARGIVVLRSSIPRSTVVVEAAAAGPEEVDFLKERYGPLLVVTSWLRLLDD